MRVYDKDLQTLIQKIDDLELFDAAFESKVDEYESVVLNELRSLDDERKRDLIYQILAKRLAIMRVQIESNSKRVNLSNKLLAKTAHSMKLLFKDLYKKSGRLSPKSKPDKQNLA